MQRLIWTTAAAAIAGLALSTHATAERAAAPATNGYEFLNCAADPPPFTADSWDFLPIFVAGEDPGFVDLGQTVSHAGNTWAAMQYSRDKDFGVVSDGQNFGPLTTGSWLAGIVGDEWPAGTVNVKREMLATQIETIEVDGLSHAVNPSCLRDFDFGEDGVLALYNVWVRFQTPGLHTVKITARQVRDFYFVFPFDLLGIADPKGLGGRRVFVQGETVGDTLDDRIVHEYALNIGTPSRH